MNHTSRIIYVVLIALLLTKTTSGQNLPVGDSWYTNPLGFSPIDLHTKNGFLYPALVVGAVLLFTSPDSGFVKERFWGAEGGASFGYKYPYTNLVQANGSVGVFVRKWLSVGVDAGLTMPQDKYNSTIGISIRPFARFYFLQYRTWQAYFESGGGIIYFVDKFPVATEQDPRTGLNVNGTTRYGIGIDANLSEQSRINFGIRHVHISNGNAKGVEHNPSHDSNGFFAGYVLKF